MKFIKVSTNKDSSPIYVNVDNICAVRNDHVRFVDGVYSSEIVLNNCSIFAYQSVAEVMQLINEGE